MHLIDEQREMMNVFLSRTLTLSATEKICGDEIWQEYESLLHDQGMDYSEQRVRLHEIKCKNENVCVSDRKRKYIRMG